jgi:quercetin dioxygenase-like cupin family protein
MARTRPEQVAALRRISPADAERIVVRPLPDARGETALIGDDTPLGGGHGFNLTRLNLGAGETFERTRRDGVEVLYVQRGTLEFRWGDGQATLATGDTLTVPAGLPRQFRAGSEGAVVYVVRDGDRVPELYAA